MSLMDLVALGNSDRYLTDPYPTYFQNAYRRHTNFVICEGDQFPYKNESKELRHGILCDIYRWLVYLMYPLPKYHTKKSLGEALMESDCNIRFGSDLLVMKQILKFYDYDNQIMSNKIPQFEESKKNIDMETKYDRQNQWKR